MISYAYHTMESLSKDTMEVVEDNTDWIIGVSLGIVTMSSGFIHTQTVKLGLYDIAISANIISNLGLNFQKLAHSLGD